MDCYLKTYSTNKAKLDIDRFCEAEGFRNVAVDLGKGKVKLFFSKLLTVATLPFRIGQGDVLLIQYPYKKFYEKLCRIARSRGAKTVTLIHDLGSFRRSKLTPQQEIKRLSYTDAIVVHNASMRRWLEEQGCKVPMVELDIFDYLSDSNPADYDASARRREIVYAGGLAPRKNRYLYDLTPELGDFKWMVCGSGLDTAMLPENTPVQYKGFIPSDRFIAEIRGGWGLVWDGDSIDGCTGNWGDYLRYNNPHKASFYLRSGLPLILWSKSAMAPFIQRKGIGIAVDSLRDLNEAIGAVSEEEYAEMKRRVAEECRLLQEGHHFREAYCKAKDRIS